MKLWKKEWNEICLIFSSLSLEMKKKWKKVVDLFSTLVQLPAIILKIFRQKKSPVMCSVWKNKSYRYFLYLNIKNILEKKNCTYFESNSTRVFQCQVFFFSIVEISSDFWFLKVEFFFSLVGFIHLLEQVKFRPNMYFLSFSCVIFENLRFLSF